MSSYRPRRTRIYGANYDIGESYYKPALQRLDNKPVPGLSRYTPTVSFSEDTREPSILKLSPIEDRRSIREPSILKLPSIEDRRSILRDTFDDDFQISSSLPARKRFPRSEDLQLDDSSDFSRILRKPIFDDDEQDFQLNGVRQIKLRSKNVFQEESSSSSVTAAASRAKQSRARLADLESEMQGISDKQHEREQRKLHLKKILSENYDD